MKNKKISIVDVAKEAGVSIATVSRVMNEPRKVGESSRKKVHDAFDTLHFVPHVYTKKNNDKKNKTLALIVPSASNAFFSKMVEGVLMASDENQIRVLVFSCHGKTENEEICLRSAAKACVDGVLFCPLCDGSSSLVRQLFPKDFPLLILYRRDYLSGVPHIYHNNVQGGYLATKLLLKSGRRNIVFFVSFWRPPVETLEEMLSYMDGPKRGSYSSLDRLFGYQMALEEVGLSLDETLLSMTSYDFEGGYQQAKKFISRLRDFDSVVCSNDSVAAGVMQALHEQNILVPEQVSIVGYDDSVLAEITRPGLTSVHQDPERLGKCAVAMCLSLFEGESVPDMVLDTHLTIRNSTAMRQEISS